MSWGKKGGEEHRHSYSRRETGVEYDYFTGPDGERRCVKTVTWEEACSCGDVRSTGSHSESC